MPTANRAPLPKKFPMPSCSAPTPWFFWSAKFLKSRAIWLTHTRPDLYPEPYAFRPERFLEDAPTTYGWVPFGGGIRRCLGAAFAEMEMRVVLETVLQRRALGPASGRAERVTRRNVTFSPRNGTLLRSRRRSAPAPAADPDLVLVA